MNTAPSTLERPTCDPADRSKKETSLARLVSSCKRSIGSPLAWILYLANPNRMKLAQKKNLTREEALRIVNDPDPAVRRELAWNKSTSEEILFSLLKDSDRQVVAVARRRYIKTTLSGT